MSCLGCGNHDCEDCGKSQELYPPHDPCPPGNPCKDTKAQEGKCIGGEICPPWLPLLSTANRLLLIGAYLPGKDCFFYLRDDQPGFVIVDGHCGHTISNSPCFKIPELANCIEDNEGNLIIVDGEVLRPKPPPFPFLLVKDQKGCMREVRGPSKGNTFLAYEKGCFIFKGLYDTGICTTEKINTSKTLQLAGFAPPSDCPTCPGDEKKQCLEILSGACGFVWLDKDGNASVYSMGELPSCSGNGAVWGYNSSPTSCQKPGLIGFKFPLTVENGCVTLKKLAPLYITENGELAIQGPRDADGNPVSNPQDYVLQENDGVVTWVEMESGSDIIYGNVEHPGGDGAMAIFTLPWDAYVIVDYWVGVGAGDRSDQNLDSHKRLQIDGSNVVSFGVQAKGWNRSASTNSQMSVHELAAGNHIIRIGGDTYPHGDWDQSYISYYAIRK